jgi:Flp pilus assembly protein TadG
MWSRRAAGGGKAHHGRPSRVRHAARVSGRVVSALRRTTSRAAVGDRGATIVEFALLLPMLLLIVLGIIDFGRMLNAQVTLTQAAREGSRLVALGQPNVVSRTQAAATGLSPVGVSVTQACPTGAGATSSGAVQTTYTFSFTPGLGNIVSLLGGNGMSGQITLSAQGVMPCET